MSAYWELCRCGHTYYHHAWVPLPDQKPEDVPTRCTSCCCEAFDGTGQFDLSESPLVAGNKPAGRQDGSDG